MKMQRTLRMYSWALIVSGLLNAFLISSAFVTPSNAVASLYLRAANWVAVPPGYFANKIFVPRQHTAISFITSGLESLCLSFRNPQPTAQRRQSRSDAPGRTESPVLSLIAQETFDQGSEQWRLLLHRVMATLTE
jgi:hypothetical protein